MFYSVEENSAGTYTVYCQGEDPTRPGFADAYAVFRRLETAERYASMGNEGNLSSWETPNDEWPDDDFDFEGAVIE